MFREINSEFSDIDKEIQLKVFDLNEAYEAWRMAKLEYERTFSMKLLEEKARNPSRTMPEVKALAVALSYESHLEAIKSESKYRKIQNEVRALRDRLDGLREKSSNLRRESQL